MVTKAFLNSLFCVNDFSKVPAIKQGQQFEHTAVNAYLKGMAEIGRPVHVQECGLVLHTRLSYLGASPDGMVFDSSAKPRFGLLEVKCPYQPFVDRLTVRQACRLSTFCCEVDGDIIRLKRNHQYFFQVQGQMAVCKASWHDFFVWLNNSTFKEWIFSMKFLCRGWLGYC